jgi:hypothetical protein
VVEVRSLAWTFIMFMMCNEQGWKWEWRLGSIVFHIEEALPNALKGRNCPSQ